MPYFAISETIAAIFAAGALSASMRSAILDSAGCIRFVCWSAIHSLYSINGTLCLHGIQPRSSNAPDQKRAGISRRGGNQCARLQHLVAGKQFIGIGLSYAAPLLRPRITGISSYIRPLSSLPAAFLFRPPHCLKKNLTPCSTHCL